MLAGNGAAADVAATGMASLASVAMAGVPSPALCGLLVLASLGGLAIDVWSHRARRARLAALAPQSDERVSLTLARYAQLWPRVRKLWAAEAVCCAVLAAAVMLAFGSAPAGVAAPAAFAPASALAFLLAAAAALGQLCVHAQHRNLFYELPVQVRWVAKLRK